MRYLISLFFGLALGSFANVCILRMPEDQSICFPNSHCPACGCALKVRHNIPLISFLALKGRCASCHATISWQYPLVEALMAALFLFHAWYFSGAISRLILTDIVTFYLVVISIIDYRHRIIPDELSLSMLALGLALSWINPYLPYSPLLKAAQSLAAALGGGLLMLGLAYAGEKAFKKEALGGGDIKLIAASGAVLGWRGVIGPLMLGSFSGGFLALLLLIGKKKKLGETLPFGPFLSFGIYLTCFFPDWWVPFFRIQ